MSNKNKGIILIAAVIGMVFSPVTMSGVYNAKAESKAEEVRYEAAAAVTEVTETAVETEKAAEAEAEEKTEATVKAETVVKEKKKAEKKTEKKTASVTEENKSETKKAKTETNAYGIKLTAKDKENLYRLVQSEVGYMDEKSKLLVASVVLNRVKDKAFPDTVTGVVMQKLGRVYQFSPVKPGGRFWTCKVDDSTKKAVDKVLKNGDYSKGALYFVAKRYTTASRSSWFDRNLKWLYHHGGQDYYK